MSTLPFRPAPRLTFRPSTDYLLGWSTGAYDVSIRLDWGVDRREVSILHLMAYCEKQLSGGQNLPYIEGMRDAYLVALEG